MKPQLKSHSLVAMGCGEICNLSESRFPHPHMTQIEPTSEDWAGQEGNTL